MFRLQFDYTDLPGHERSGYWAVFSAHSLYRLDPGEIVTQAAVGEDRVRSKVMR
ncbi:MAG TPA: hypothetical protein VGL25_07810 [Casimicrobiaceae bacterium]|jgi:hypothetical protein